MIQNPAIQRVLKSVTASDYSDNITTAEITDYGELKITLPENVGEVHQVFLMKEKYVAFISEDTEYGRRFMCYEAVHDGGATPADRFEFNATWVEEEWIGGNRVIYSGGGNAWIDRFKRGTIFWAFITYTPVV